MPEIYNKNVLITGSTSGIGLGIAEKFIATNHNVIINGVETPDQMESFLQKMSSKTTGKIAYCQADLTKICEIEKMINFSKEKFSNIDILINNAGMQFTSPIESFPPDMWDKIIALNLSAAFHTTRLLIGEMQKKGWGRIINIASAHGVVGSMHKSAYVASKHGIVGLTKVVALENCQNGITCNAICPGWVLTPLVEKQINQKALETNTNFEQATKELLLQKQPSGQFVKPSEIGEYCYFLTNDASSQINGSILTIDGGWTAQ